MNILFVLYKLADPNKGGVERVTCLLKEEFERRGHRIELLTVGDVEDKYEVPEGNMILPVNTLPEDEFRNRFIKLIDVKGIDVIIFQDIQECITKTMDFAPRHILKLCVLHNQPYSFYGKERMVKKNTPSNSLPFKGKLLKWLAIINPKLFRKLYLRKTHDRISRIVSSTDKFILLSEEYKKKILRLNDRIDGMKLDAIPNPFTFTPLEETVDEDKENIVVMVSRLSNPQKNITGFIDVWKSFSKLHPDWKAVVAGDGEHRQMIERYAAKQKVVNLEFVGNRKDIQSFYKRARILCMTSAYEGWPMALMEAMAFGCVPVAYDSFEALGDIVTNGSNGFLIKPFEKTEMSLCLSSLASDSEMRIRMQKAGIEKIKDFNVSKIVDTWERKLSAYNKERE